MIYQHKLLKLIDPGRDSLRLYNLGNQYKPKILHFGVKGSYDPEGTLMV